MRRRCITGGGDSATGSSLWEVGKRQDVKAMARMLIRVDAELTDELSHAFPHLTARSHPASTTLTGDVVDQQELQGVLNLLSSLGIDVVEVLTIPED